MGTIIETSHPRLLDAGPPLLEVKKPGQETVEGSIGRGERTGKLLRTLGAIMVVAASGMFLVQRWDVLTHFNRYIAFLCFTSVLAASGLLCGLKVKEVKSARTFLALVAGSIPIHFAALGALLYSNFLGAGDFGRYPSALLWQASLPEALFAIGIGTVVLVPLGFFAFRVLAREAAINLTVATFVGGALLLLPTREPALVAIIFSLAFVAHAVHDRMLRRIPGLTTFEGTIARGVPALILCILVGRQITLYGLTSALQAAFFVALTYILLRETKSTTNESRAIFAELAALGTAFAAWSCSVDVVRDLSLLSFDQFQLFQRYSLAVIALVLSRSVKPTRMLWEGIGVGQACFTALWAVSRMPGWDTSLLSLAVSVAITTYACIAERRTFLFVGIVTFGGVMAHQVRDAFELMQTSPWISLAVIGTATIIAASLVERHYPALERRFRDARKEVAGWSL